LPIRPTARRLLAVTRLRRPLIALCVAALASSGVAACGSSSGGALSGKDAQGVLKETFGPDKPVKSGQLNLALNLDAQGLSGISGPIGARLTGPFQSEGGKTLPAFDFALTVSAGGQSFSAGATSTGKKGYVSLAGQNYDIGDQLYQSFKQGYEQSAKSAKGGKQGQTLSALGIDPLRWLKNPRKAGEQQVGGVQAVHVTSDIDVAKLLADVNTLLGKADQLGVPGTTTKGVPRGISAQTQQQIAQSVKTARLDVWSGKDDGILRRMTIDVTFSVPQGAQSKAGGLKSGHLTGDLTLADLNAKQTINPPANARPLSDLTSALNGLIGGGSSSGSGSSGSGSSGSSGSSGASGSGSSSGTSSSKYLQCLQQAGSDLAKVQKCAALVGQ
jgi:hypothetical protein